MELRFHSVVVITCASHAQGPQFEPGWNQIIIYYVITGLVDFITGFFNF